VKNRHLRILLSTLIVALTATSLLTIGITIQSVSAVGQWETIANAPVTWGANNGHRIEAMGNYIYFWQGDGSGFYRYDPSNNTWYSLASSPFTSSYAIGMVAAEDPAGNPAIYIMGGTTSANSQRWGRYTEYNNSWTTLSTSIPWSGSALQASATQKPANGTEFVWDGGDIIYFFPGSAYSYNRYDWYYYTISTNTWTYKGEFGVSGDPKNGPGNSGCFVTYNGENYIYIQFGHTPSGDYRAAKFMRYQISTNTWTQMTQWNSVVPGEGGADDGADLVWDGRDNLYLFPGAYCEASTRAIDEYRFLTYSISNDTWTALPDFPSPGGQGNGSDDGGAAGIVGDYVYLLKGNDGNGDTPSTLFYRYQMPPATPTARATGPTGSTNNPSVSITYNYALTPTSVKLYYTTDGGANWTLAGEDTSVDGTFDYDITSGDGTYGWNAVAIGGGSTETDPPAGGTPPEAASLILDTTPPQAPTLVSPTDGTVTDVRTPTFTWNSVIDPWNLSSPSMGNWQMDEGSGTTTADSSGNGNTGTLTNGPTWADGMSGKCLNFDGIDDYVSVPDAASLDFTNAMTVAAWVKLDDTTKTHGIASKSGQVDGEFPSWGLWYNSARQKFGFSFREDDGTIYSSTTPTTGTWYHVAATYDGAYTRLYVNGVLENTRPYSTPIAVTDYPLYIGCGSWNILPCEYWDGLIDEVAVYNRALSSSGVTYQIQVDNDPNFTSPEDNVAGLGVTTYTSPVLADENYGWRVRAVDGVGNPSAWSSVWTLLIVGNLSWTQTSWKGGPTEPSLQVGTWDITYDNFYDKENVDWSAGVKLESQSGVYSNGWFESSIFDASIPVDWGMVSWNASTPSSIAVDNYTYVSSYSAVRGTVTNFDNQKSASDGGAYSTLAEMGSSGGINITENFEHGGEQPAGWSFQNNWQIQSNRNNTPGGTYSAGVTGNAGSTNILISNKVDFTGFTVISLSFNVYASSAAAPSTITVDASIDGGTTWTVPVKAAFNPSDSAWLYVQVTNISGLAGQSNVKFRWTMVKAGATTAYCVIDDVTITASVSGSVNITEGFENSGNWPYGWVPMDRWGIKTNRNHSGSYSAGVTGGAGSTNYLYSRSFDFTGCSNIQLSYWAYASTAAASSQLTVHASIDGGSTWPILVCATTTPGSNTWKKITSLSDLSGLANKNNVKFRFTMVKSGATTAYCNIDDVAITADRITHWDMEINETISSIPLIADTRTLQMRYKLANSNDSFNVQVWDGSAWNTRGDTLNSTIWTDWSYALLSSEVISGIVQVKFVDVNPNSTAQDSILKDYLRVKSYSDQYSTSIVVKLRTGGTENAYDGTWSDWYTHDNNTENPSMPDNRYLQYRVELYTTNQYYTPLLIDLMVIRYPTIRRVSVEIDPSSQSGANNATLTYTVTVTNTGNVSDSYILTPSDTTGWSPSVSPTSLVNVSPGETRLATLSVTIPSDAIGGTTDDLSVIAESLIAGSNSAGCAATVNISRSVSVSISPPSRSGGNGETLDYTVTVNNTGNVWDEYFLTASDTTGWSPSVSPTCIVVPAFSSGNATLSVTIPAHAYGGTVDTITVTVTDGSENASSCTAEVTVLPGGSVSIAPPMEYGLGGDTLTYTVTVYNTGNVDDTYTLDNVDTLGWDLSLSNTSVAVPAFSSDSSTILSVNIPAHAYGGTVDNITVTATGTYGNSCSNSCLVEIVIVKSVSVSISPSSQSGPNGVTLTYIVTVNNTGNVDDIYDLTSNDNVGWDLSVPTPISVAAFSSGDATLTMTIPSDAVGGTIDNITVTATSQTDTTVSASSSCTAEAQCKLTMATNFGTTSPSVGDTWENAGTVLTISATAPSAGPGERYVWNGWTGTGSGSYTGMDNPSSVTFGPDPISETASWTRQYYLTLAVSPPGVVTIPTGSDWYDDGTIVSISTDSSAVYDSYTYYFDGWGTTDMGEIDNWMSTSTTVLMDKAKTVTANYIRLTSATGGNSMGYWANKGNSSINIDDVLALNGLDPYATFTPYFKEPDGSTPFSFTVSVAQGQVKGYILNANAKDMRYMLAAQLLATELNVMHGFLSGSQRVWIDYNGDGIYEPGEGPTIDQIMAEAIAAWSSGDRASQECYKDLLDGINNNRLLFVV